MEDEIEAVDELEDAGDVEAWIRHPRSAKLRREYKSRRAAAHSNLLRHCETSSDPEVRSALWEYRHCTRVMEILTNKEEG